MPTMTALTTPQRIAAIADQLAYCTIADDDALYVNQQGTEFKRRPASEQGSHAHRGWTMCLSRIADITGLGDTSDDGVREAEAVNAWMEAQP